MLRHIRTVRPRARTTALVAAVALAAAGVALAVGVQADNYWVLFPGLVLFGVGLALVLTVNDPVSLDTLPEPTHGQASGVSATAEQFGGAVGISVLYLLFHATYVSRLHTNIDASPLADLTGAQYAQLKADLIAAEQTGLHPASFDPSLVGYLKSTLDASNWGFAAAFLAASVLSVVGLLVVWRMVRSPATRVGGAGVAGTAPFADEPIEPGD